MMPSPDKEKDRLIAEWVRLGKEIGHSQELEASGGGGPYLGSAIMSQVLAQAELFDACMAAGATSEEMWAAELATEKSIGAKD